MDRSQTQGRNRDERRTVSAFDPAGHLAGKPWQPYVAAIIQVEREVFIRNPATGLLRRTAEKTFYICKASVAAQPAATAIRAHWRIENTSHYARDVTLGEDRSRIRTNPACSPDCVPSRSTSPKQTAREP